MINKSPTLIFICSLLLSSIAYTKVHEYIEDAYATQAPQEIIALAEQVAQSIEFYDPYQVVVPKKPGVEINPWNNFVSYGHNPQAQLPFILVNETWFAQLNHDEQIFLLARCFMALKQPKPLSMQVFPYTLILLVILASIGLFIALGRSRLGQYTFWIRVVVVYVILVISNLAFLNSLQSKFLTYLGTRYDRAVIRSTLEKTGNREAAIKALEHFDTSIKDALNKGELFFTPYEKMFESYAKTLKDETSN